jgi:hypothetical protein
VPPSARRNAFLCALFVGVCILVAYPVSSDGYLDDFSYARTALEFARTGHIVYNGWTAPIEGWMIGWGALFIKLFGFSFNILRLSTLPIALGAVYLFHRILTRFDVRQRNASIGALALGLSPMFFPLATSFMTDVPGLFVLLLCIYMCQRAVTSATARETLFWLLSAALLNLIGGTVRQVAWLGVLVMVPSTGWLLRQRRGVLPASLAAAFVSLIGIVALIHWFSSRPYMANDAATQFGIAHHYSVRTLVEELIKLFLCLLLFVLPLLAAWWPTIGQLTRSSFLRGSVMFGVLAFCLKDAIHRERLYVWLAPWLYCTVSRYPRAFGAATVDQLFGSSVDVPKWLGVALAVVTVGAAFILVEQLITKKARWQPEVNGLSSADRSAFWILGPFSFAYVLLLFPRAEMFGLFDRYALCLMPPAIVLLLLIYQRSIGPAIPAVCIIVLAIFTVDAVGDTHDTYADQRAGDLAVQKLVAGGVPRTSISQSINTDLWLQVYIAGHVHNEEASAGNQGLSPALPNHVPAVPCPTRLEQLALAPVVKPDHYVVISPSSCLQPSSYPPVSYRAWLPPFHRNEYIELPKYTLH